MEHEDLLNYLQNVGVDPSRLIFEDELTRIYNRRFLLNYLQHKIDWDALESDPVSLLMIDLDHFKSINDTHGHDVGDQALIWAAQLITKVSTENGLAIRYAGDEFMILMPGADKSKAVKVAKALLQGDPDEPTPLEAIGSDLSMTFSIGIASAPEDVTVSKDLIHQADMALYQAKNAGRNQFSDGGQRASQEGFPKATLHRIDRGVISGRDIQLSRVTEALENFSRQQNQFLIIEGDDGMGKSEFLKSIRLDIGEGDFCQIEVKGILQEGFRPYYMGTNILVGIMNQCPDKGVDILESLTPRETAYLSSILPQLGEPEEMSQHEDPKTQREGLFATLIHLIEKLLDSRPLIVLVDDLHLSDEATLLLFRKLLLRQEIPLFLCGTSLPLQAEESEGSPTPLEKFFTAFHEELNVVSVPLTPLTAADIAQHFKAIFPQVHLPENVEERLAQLTQGNPLFVGEILRKLVRDGKITLTGQRWVLEPLEEEYLPQSLEEIVSQKIALLDEESRHLLEQASTFGEDVSLSMLTGSSEVTESKVLELIDQAAAQGLISSDYEMNDERIRFLSKGVMDLTYQGIEDDRKQELHEQIGAYQENLYAENLLPSSATLSYHFQLSANQKKAGLYRELTQASDERVFNATEAVEYTGEKVPGMGLETLKLRILDPLDRSTVTQIPEVIETLLATVSALEQSSSDDHTSAIRKLKDKIDAVLKSGDQLHITHSETQLLVNGEAMDVTKHGTIAEAFIHLLVRSQLRGIAFFQGLSAQELSAMLKGLAEISGKRIPWGFWQGFTLEHDLNHVEFKQMSYTSRVTVAASLTMPETPQTYAEAVPEADPAAGGTDEEEEAQQDEQDLEPISLKEAPEEPLQVAGSKPVALVSESAPILKISSQDVALTDSFLESAAATLGGLFLRGAQDEASRLLKRELVLEGLPEQRIRILEVIDTITRDLKRELTYAIEDKNPRIRRAAFQLVERLQDPRITSLLLDYTQHQDSAIAIAAIESLAKINPGQAVEALLALMSSIKETEHLIACCRALGKIGDPAGIEPLSSILAPSGFLSFGKTKSPQLRATAAFALAQIQDPQVSEVLSQYLDDPDRRVRQTAEDFVNG